MEMTKALDKINNIVNQIDYKNVYIEIKTKSDTYTLDKQKPRNPIGFNTTKGGE